MPRLDFVIARGKAQDFGEIAVTHLLLGNRDAHLLETLDRDTVHALALGAIFTRAHERDDTIACLLDI